MIIIEKIDIEECRYYVGKKNYIIEKEERMPEILRNPEYRITTEEKLIKAMDGATVMFGVTFYLNGTRKGEVKEKLFDAVKVSRKEVERLLELNERATIYRDSTPWGVIRWDYGWFFEVYNIETYKKVVGILEEIVGGK